MHVQKTTSSNRIQRLADLFHQTADDHHVAYAATDGVDADWSIWYSGHLLEEGIEQILDAKLLKSDLIYLLVLADKQVDDGSPRRTLGTLLCRLLLEPLSQVSYPVIVR